jgi:DUF4097 and DUF4098 domain-containing protein YvlB
MKLQRFEASASPQLTIKCHGDLDVNGGREGEVAIKAYGADEDLNVEVDGEHFTITSRARCKIGCPSGTDVMLESVHGSARIRRLDGSITAENIYGTAVFKEVGPTTVKMAAGDMRVRTVNGDLRSEQVSGDLSVRGIEGMLVCKNVGGDLSATDLEGGLEAAVGGDCSLKTGFSPGCSYKLEAGGDAAVKFPANTNLSIKVSAGGDIHHRADWAALSDSSHTLDGRIGEGDDAADLTISAGGDVALQSKSNGDAFVANFILEDEDLELELESMAEEIERNIEAHMARLNAHLEAQLSHIDQDAIRRNAQRAVEKTMRKAERAAEQARLKAERAQRRWERLGARRPSPPPTPKRPSEPVKEEERLMILRMVQEGKISTDEAARLLEALEG